MSLVTLGLITLDSQSLTWAVTELSKLDLTVIPSLLTKIIPATFLESWILFKVSSNSGVRVIFTAEAGLLTLKFLEKNIYYEFSCQMFKDMIKKLTS